MLNLIIHCVGDDLRIRGDRSSREDGAPSSNGASLNSTADRVTGQPAKATAEGTADVQSPAIASATRYNPKGATVPAASQPQPSAAAVRFSGPQSGRTSFFSNVFSRSSASPGGPVFGPRSSVTLGSIGSSSSSSSTNSPPVSAKASDSKHALSSANNQDSNKSSSVVYNSKVRSTLVTERQVSNATSAGKSNPSGNGNSPASAPPPPPPSPVAVIDQISNSSASSSSSEVSETEKAGNTSVPSNSVPITGASALPPAAANSAAATSTNIVTVLPTIKVPTPAADSSHTPLPLATQMLSLAESASKAILTPSSYAIPNTNTPKATNSKVGTANGALSDAAAAGHRQQHTTPVPGRATATATLDSASGASPGAPRVFRVFANAPSASPSASNGTVAVNQQTSRAADTAAVTENGSGRDSNPAAPEAASQSPVPSPSSVSSHSETGASAARPKPTESCAQEVQVLRSADADANATNAGAASGPAASPKRVRSARHSIEKDGAAAGAITGTHDDQHIDSV